MRRAIHLALMLLLVSSGCAVVKTTDVTDPSFKRHQSVAVLGWPVYTRVTDRELGSTSRLAIKSDGANQSEEIDTAEMLIQPINVAPLAAGGR